MSKNLTECIKNNPPEVAKQFSKAFGAIFYIFSYHIIKNLTPPQKSVSVVNMTVEICIEVMMTYFPDHSVKYLQHDSVEDATQKFSETCESLVRANASHREDILEFILVLLTSITPEAIIYPKYLQDSKLLFRDRNFINFIIISLNLTRHEVYKSFDESMMTLTRMVEGNTKYQHKSTEGIITQMNFMWILYPETAEHHARAFGAALSLIYSFHSITTTENLDEYLFCINKLKYGMLVTSEEKQDEYLNYSSYEDALKEYNQNIEWLYRPCPIWSSFLL